MSAGPGYAPSCRTSSGCSRPPCEEGCRRPRRWRWSASRCPVRLPTRSRVLPPRIALGVDPAEVWRSLEADAVLAPLGRTLARSARTGEPVAEALDRLGTELAARARAETEDAARQVGVRAAVPLGLCLLPSFLLLGIVPVVAGLVAELAR